MQIKALARRCFGWDRKSWREKSVTYFKIKKLPTVILCLVPLSASRLFKLFGSDKERAGGHHYGAAYDFFLRKYRYRAIKLLEIGIGGYDRGVGGESLLAWRAYFPFARLVACDIASRTELSLWRTRIYKMDQSSIADLGRLVECERKFDIIVDDGSHINEHQLFSFENLFDALAEDGIYLIEDVQTSFWHGKPGGIAWGGRHIDSPDFRLTCLGYFLELSKYLNYSEFELTSGINEKLLYRARSVKRICFEHNLIIIEKVGGRTPSTAPHV